MTFEFRKFTDANKPKYDSLHLAVPLRMFRYPPYWVIDEEHDAIVILFGGQGDQPPERGAPPDFYALVWNQQIIEFEGYQKTSFSENGDKTVSHHVIRLVIPKALEVRTDELKAMICEALPLFEKSKKYPMPNISHVEFCKVFFK